MDIDGICIRYEVHGEGPPVLLLHGWGANIEAMQPIANTVAAMGMRAVSLDFPGFGESDEPKEVWGVPEYAAFTRRFMEEMGITGADVVCHSFGGRVAIYLASGNPALFNRLVLVDAAGIRPRRTPRWYIRTYFYKFMKQLGRMRFFDRLFHISERRARAGSADYRALKSDTMRGVFVKTVNLDLTPKLKDIGNPALLIWGELDTETPLYMGKIMEAQIPDAGLVVFAGAGHYSYIDQYARFQSVLRAFFVPIKASCVHTHHDECKNPNA